VLGRELRGGFTVTVDGQSAEATAALPSVQANFASDEYFDLMRIPVPEGRAFAAEDAAGGAPVTVVNQMMAQR
jgi:hypothetical protein